MFYMVLGMEPSPHTYQASLWPLGCNPWSNLTLFMLKHKDLCGSVGKGACNRYPMTCVLFPRTHMNMEGEDRLKL